MDKKCSKCVVVKEYEEFYNDINSSDKKRPCCISCCKNDKHNRKGICLIENCGRPAFLTGHRLCVTHAKWRYEGKELTRNINPIGIPDIERFEEKYTPVPESGCWLWTGGVNKYGYGTFRWNGETVYAHRKSFELHGGIIPDGMVIDHKYIVRSCVNPKHLEVVTTQENIRRGNRVVPVSQRQYP